MPQINKKESLLEKVFTMRKMDKYIYHEQVHAKRFKSLILFPKKEFYVCEDYLYGMKEEFYVVYNELLHIFSKIYGDMEQKPEEFGLPLYRIDEFGTNTPQGRKTKINFYPLTLFVAFSVGQLSENVLCINRKIFMDQIKKYRITHINKIVDSLSRYGFVFYKDEINMYMEYKNNPHILNVLAAATDKAEKMGEVATNTKYICFYYKLFENSSSYCGEYGIDDYCKVVPEYAETINVLNAELEKLDLFPSPNGFYRLNYKNSSRKKYNDIIYLTYSAECEIYIRLKLRHIGSYADKVEKLPVHIKNALKNHLCCYCSKTCSNNNIKFKMDGEALEACCYNSFVFYRPSVDDIKYYINMIIWEKEA